MCVDNTVVCFDERVKKRAFYFRLLKAILGCDEKEAMAQAHNHVSWLNVLTLLILQCCVLEVKNLIERIYTLGIMFHESQNLIISHLRKCKTQV